MTHATDGKSLSQQKNAGYYIQNRETMSELNRDSTKAKDAITGIESGFEQTGEDTAGKRESALGE